VNLRGLLKVVPEHGAGDKGSEYCIDGFAIDRYSELLAQRHHMFPDICTRTTFVKTQQLVSNYVLHEVAALITNSKGSVVDCHAR